MLDSTRANPVTFEEFPADLIACTLAAEDKRFFQHGGIDGWATLRAFRDGIVRGRVVSGASTLTQQLIKISMPPAKRSMRTKIYEALAARHLELKWRKQQILTAYLNRLDYGNLRIGSAEAARFYFQKPLADLSLAECALLAGLPQAPSRLNPIRYPQRAMVRRSTVLNRLESNQAVELTRIRAAIAEPLSLRPMAEASPAPWLPTKAAAMSSRLPTTLDLPLQKDLELIVREETAKLKHANLRHAAVVVIHNPTGEILGLVSSADWNDQHGGQINGALTPRSPGSTLKPFTYILAMERNHRFPFSILADIPSPFKTPQGLDLPENYDHCYRGPVTLRSALACSLNLPALREVNALGGPSPLHELLENLGITTLQSDPSFYGLGLTLGNAPVRLLELTNAYATLARQGQHFPPKLFLGKSVEPHHVFDARSAYWIADILADPIARAPSFQPGGPLDLPFKCAVKTGTSSDFHDNWCVGFTPKFTIGVWAGNFEQIPMKELSGIAGAGPIFHRAMLRLHRDTPPTWFERPAELVEIRIDPRTGKRVAASDPVGAYDLAPANDLPPLAATTDYDTSGKALLDPLFAEWFASSYNLRRSVLAMDLSQATSVPFQIISPAADTTFLLDPEIPSGSSKLRPVTSIPGAARWSSETLRIEPSSPEPIIHLTPGIHRLTATHPESGVTRTITLHVKSI